LGSTPQGTPFGYLLGLEVEIKRAVRFSVANGAIQVRDQSDVVIVEGRVTVSEDGVCRIKVGDMELDSWQFRRRALEALFFELP
jgi:hypothetical protein